MKSCPGHGGAELSELCQRGGWYELALKLVEWLRRGEWQCVGRVPRESMHLRRLATDTMGGDGLAAELCLLLLTEVRLDPSRTSRTRVYARRVVDRSRALTGRPVPLDELRYTRVVPKQLGVLLCVELQQRLFRARVQTEAETQARLVVDEWHAVLVCPESTSSEPRRGPNGGNGSSRRGQGIGGGGSDVPGVPFAATTEAHREASMRANDDNRRESAILSSCTRDVTVRVIRALALTSSFCNDLDR
jgi:hypothetical protein